MLLALRQLSALYLTAAAAYTVAIALSQHPALADRAGETSMYVRVQGAEATTALENYVLRPGLSFAHHEARLLAHGMIAALESKMPERRVVNVPRVVRRIAATFPARMHEQAKARVEGFPPPPANLTPLRRDEPALRPSEDEAWRARASKSAPSNGERNVAASAQPMGGAVQPQHLAKADRSRMQVAPDTEETPSPSDVTPGTATAVPNLPQPSTAEIAQVEQRLKDSLTSEMYDNFELFLYVSKAANGPAAQRMYVFEKEPTGDLALAYNWPVSTGRERIEYNSNGRELPSFTPRGYYELDPHRFFPHYWSNQWNEPMPYAMFFNWKKDGQDTGLAIHAASGSDAGLLGSRASAGCIRLPPDAAHTLFNLIRTRYRGLTPKFAYDRRTGTMSNDGILLHDADGHLQLAEGYKVLVFIEDYGGENVVAAMY